jgi:hypothetical protein
MAGGYSVRGLKKGINAAFSNFQIIAMVPVAAIAVVSVQLGWRHLKESIQTAGVIKRHSIGPPKVFFIMQHGQQEGQHQPLLQWDR